MGETNFQIRSLRATATTVTSGWWFPLEPDHLGWDLGSASSEL